MISYFIQLYKSAFYVIISLIYYIKQYRINHLGFVFLLVIKTLAEDDLYNL